MRINFDTIFAELEAKGFRYYNYLNGELEQIVECTNEEVEVPAYHYYYVQYQQDCLDSTKKRTMTNEIWSDTKLTAEDLGDIMFLLTDINYDTVRFNWSMI